MDTSYPGPEGILGEENLAPRQRRGPEQLRSSILLAAPQPFFHLDYLADFFGSRLEPRLLAVVCMDAELLED